MMEEAGVTKVQLGSTALSLIFDKIIRSIPWAAYVFCCCVKCSKKKRAILFFLTLITVFPLGISRNAAAMYWIPIFILKFEKYLKENRFVYIMLFGILIIFPFLNNFRHFSGKINFEFSFDSLNSMNMDASQIFMATMKENLITYGNQLLGALLFFFPRSLWPSKPVGSGYFLVDYMNGGHPNVSMPFFSEGFINFGFPGIILFIVLIGWFTGKLDRDFWSGHRLKHFQPRDGFYLIFLGAIVFIMRGDLMSSFAFTVGICIAYYLVGEFARTKFSFLKINHNLTS